jgi:hypothetical protein
MRVMCANLDGSQVETLVETGRGDTDRGDQTRWCVGITIDPKLECDALRDNDSTIPAVEIGPLDRAVVEVRDAHVGPIDMTGLRIHDDAVGEMAIGSDGLAVGAVGIHRVNAVAAQFEKE